LAVKQRILSTLLRGLAYLHSERVLHRDLSPRNVLLTEDYQAVISDFESSKDAAAQQASMALRSHIITTARFACVVGEWLCLTAVFALSVLM
jgi:serine/threonine protein kinase